MPMRTAFFSSFTTFLIPSPPLSVRTFPLAMPSTRFLAGGRFLPTIWRSPIVRIRRIVIFRRTIRIVRAFTPIRVEKTPHPLGPKRGIPIVAPNAGTLASRRWHRSRDRNGCQSRRVYPTQRITVYVRVGIQPTRQSDRIALDIAPRRGVIIPEVVVNFSALRLPCLNFWISPCAVSELATDSS